MSERDGAGPRRPDIVALGDGAVLVRFSESLDDSANRSVLALAARLACEPIAGVREVVPSLVSILLRYDPEQIGPVRLAGEIALRLGRDEAVGAGEDHDIAIRFDGEDLAEVASRLGMNIKDFIARHNALPLRVLTTGFAPGFVYCGFHPDDLVLPRRNLVRPMVRAGSVLFAAGQTAIAATDIPTGWHVIGSTEYRNFSPERDPPTRLQAGDLVRFGLAP